MVTIPTMTLAALPMECTPRVATQQWQMQNATFAVPAARALGTAVAGYGTSGFAASAVVTDKHSRQAKPAAPPRGSR